MSIRFRCNYCGSNVEAFAEGSGGAVTCPACQNPLEVPGPRPTTADVLRAVPTWQLPLVILGIACAMAIAAVCLFVVLVVAITALGATPTNVIP